MEECKTKILENTLADTEYCSDDGDGSYIEIELDYNDDDQNKNSCMEGDVVEQEEYQLRISISVSLPEVRKESVNVHTDETKVAAIARNYADSQATLKPGQHLRPRGLWEIPQPDGQTTMSGTSTTRVIPYDNVELYASTMKQQSLTTTTTSTNGIMMKLLIKFRGTKMGALFASLIKPRQPRGHNHRSSKKSKTFFQCYDQKGLVNPSNGRRSKQWNLEDDSFRNCKKSKSCRVMMEMELGAVKGIFNAMGMSIGQRGGRNKSKRGSGRSTSCNNSPIHHDEGFSSLCSSTESSVQAAIAYCKSSLGQTSDFTIRNSVSSAPSRFVT